MVAADDGPAPEARPPRLDDLVALCASLNREGARYVVIGGMAVIQAGFVRATEDIDLLIDPSLDNLARVRRGLLELPDHAVRDMADEDLDRYVVVRVADEIVVDLMRAACGVTWADAKQDVESSRFKACRFRSQVPSCSGVPSRRFATRTVLIERFWRGFSGGRRAGTSERTRADADSVMRNPL